MFISHGIWLLRTRELRRLARDAELIFDDLPEAIEWQAGGFKLPKLPKMNWFKLRKRQRCQEDHAIGLQRPPIPTETAV
jgi:hypothetical protein